MKVTKAMAIVTALVMIAICFNTSAVFSNDEHPWDQDGTGGNPGSDGGRDTTSTGGSIASVSPIDSGKFSKGGLARFESFLLTVRFVAWYRDIPSMKIINAKGVVVKSGGSRVTNAKAK